MKMPWGNNNERSTLFVLQEDGRFGSVSSDRMDVGGEDMVNHIDGFVTGARKAFLNSSVQIGRYRLGLVLLIVTFFIFFGRAAHLQIVQGKYYASLSENNRYRTELLVPARGIILDRKGEVIASNEPTFVLTMRIADLPDGDDERGELFERIGDLVGLQRTDLDLLYSDYISRPNDLIPVKETLLYENAIRLAIEVSDLPGFDLQTTTKRVYSSVAPSLSHVLGYTGPLSREDLDVYKDKGYRSIDTIGKAGIEREAEELLRGIPGALVYEVDARGKKLAIASKTDPVVGANVSLGIDLRFQKFIEQGLSETLKSVGASRGSVVAIDPQTGAVRALVSLPTFDSNEFVGGIDADRYYALLEDEDQPLFPRAIAGEYPSGSTFKPFVAYAAMVEGIVNERTSFLSTGGLTIGQWFFPDWKAGGHGITDVRKAISESVNTYFYIIGGGFDTTTGLGVTRITDYAARFGFGSPTGIDLPGEADGFLPSKEWKEEVKGERWYVGDTYHLAIGQGDFLTTPIQMAMATAMIANGGYQFEPYLIETVDGYGSVDLTRGSQEPMEGLDSYAMEVVRQGMRQAVTTGSARSMLSLTQAVAGKTGTAQTPGDRPYHSWFTGFAPYDNPNIALTVLIEEGGESTEAAVPLARQVLDWWFRYGM